MSLELSDESQFPADVQGVMQPERPTQLTDAQVPLQRFGVLWEVVPLLSSLPQLNGVAQSVDELGRRGDVSRFSFVFFLFTSQQAAERGASDSASPERAGRERAGEGRFSGQ